MCFLTTKRVVGQNGETDKMYPSETSEIGKVKWSGDRAPVIRILEGNPSTNAGQQLIKLGLGRPKVQLKAAVIYMLEKVVILPELVAPPGDVVDPCTAAVAPLFALPQQIKHPTRSM